MNVLLSCVGRRNYMVDYFRQAIHPYGKVIAVNSEPNTTGMQVADKSYVLPKVNDHNYIDLLFDISRQENVSLVVSLFDIDLPYLAEARNRFLNAGIQVAVSDPYVIEIANDKWLTYEFLVRNNIATPKSYISLNDVRSALSMGEIQYPLFIKPRWGMGSIAIFRADSTDELDFFYHYSRKQISATYLKILSSKNLQESVLIQEFVPGAEFGVDVFNDLAGNHLSTIVKRKFAMRSGETDGAVTVESPEISEIGKQISSLLRHRGNMDIDVLLNDKGIPHVLELNARFGGGYPFSHLAGARFPDALVAMVKGEAPCCGSVKIGVSGLKSIAMMPIRL